MSIPHTVRFPGRARKPQARAVNVRNDGAVNNGAKTASSVISDAGAGSTASGSTAVRSGQGPDPADLVRTGAVLRRSRTLGGARAALG